MAHFDLIVVGGGSGGVACGRRAASYGAKVALCEDNRVGGTCVIRGCIPKKLMRYGAHFADHFRAARGYGWQLGEPKLDWPALIGARNKEIQRLNGIYLDMLAKAGVEVIPARATLTGTNEIEADGQRHTAERILVAVGARPSLPELPGIEHALTSDHALEHLEEIPERLAVIGAGYIGIELASILNGLGVDTTLILRRDLPLRGFDQDLREVLVEEFRAHGLKILAETTVSTIERDGAGVVLSTSAGRQSFDAVLYATGRHPIANTGGLGLEELGVRTDQSGAIRVDQSYQSSVPTIYAVGDCSDHGGNGIDSGGFDLTPVAIAEGRAIAERLYNANVQIVNYDTIPTAVFGLPEAASVGLTEDRARDAGHDVAIYRTRFRPLLHTLTGEPTKTMMKLVVDRQSDRVLGCHMVGDDAAEVIQGLAVALTAGATKTHFDDTVGLHPTAAEEFVTMYQETV
ncbi:MAG: glutathione-disulfide reductase [Pseudomonadota bacterium]